MSGSAGSGDGDPSRLLSVAEARACMVAAVGARDVERVPLREAIGRVLAADVVASRDQPPFDASAMDGWAVNAPGADTGAVTLAVVGESAAGHPNAGAVGEGQAVRIFTGAPVPQGCDRVVPQERASSAGGAVTLGPLAGASSYIRPRGGDFRSGEHLLASGMRLDAWRAVLAAAAGLDAVEVATRPALALITTGQELVAAGAPSPADHQIYDSASVALASLAAEWGAVATGDHARDTPEAIRAAVARAADAALLVFVGGASVGDYDLVKPTLSQTHGLRLVVDGVNVRPGKPTWFGRLDDGRPVLGLPGNPASALVCAELFLRPMLGAWQGASESLRLVTGRLAHDLPAEGPREHWLRASLAVTDAAALEVTAFPDQDSSLTSVFARADALLLRPAGAPAVARGELVPLLKLDRL